MPEQAAREVLNWGAQAADFEADGSLRDLYVLGTTLDDWRSVLKLIFEGPFDAKLLRDRVALPMPHDARSLFGTGAVMLFFVDGMELACHFFTVEEIEFDFYPNT